MALENDGDIIQIQGSAVKPYELKNVGGVLSCSCPAWRNQSAPIDHRTCKHLKKVRGEAEEMTRIGGVSVTDKIQPNKMGATAAEHLTEGKKLRPDEKQKLYGPPVLLAHHFDYDFDPKGWWMSEKLDGVRAYWNGHDFISRQGNVFTAPEWFKRNLPPSPLDGELWIGRQMFQRTMSVVRRIDGGEMWRQVQYKVFDVPVQGTPFEERMEMAREIVRETPYASIHEHVQIDGTEFLISALKEVVALGAEGLMIREPGSLYVAARSSTLLKVKPFQDAEAVVVDFVAGKGRHKGRMGGLVVQLPDGKTFNVGTGFTDAQRENPPALGTSITYRFTELTDGGIPKCASFLRVKG